MNDILSGTLSQRSTMSGTLSASKTSSYPAYTGDYIVSPSDAEQVLNTAGKVLAKDIIINPIPYQEIENLSHGLTIYIGKEV